MANDVHPERWEPRAPSLPEPLPGSAGPLDIAMDAERGDPSPDNPARRLLLAQIKLVELQRLNERWSLAVKRLTAFAGIAVAAAAGWMVWSASRADGLVIEAFSVPPDLAQRGLTGEVVATQLLDRLARLNAESTISLRAADSYANDWTNDIDLDIPQTGVSLGEVERWLRRRLGSETRLSGEVFRTAEGLTVSARAGAEAGRAFTGSDAAFGVLMDRAAEAIFARTQPYRYAVVLNRRGRPAEAARVYAALTRTGPDSERAWGELGLALVHARTVSERGALDSYRRGAKLDPDNALVFNNLGMTGRRLGLTEAALADARRAARLLEAGRGMIRPDMLDTYRTRVRGLLALMEGDFTAAKAAYASIADEVDIGASTPTPFYHAEALIRLHETAAGLALLARTADRNPNSPASIDERNRLARTELAMFADMQRGDWEQMIARRSAVLSANAGWPPLEEHDVRRLRPLAAVALARMGRRAEAAAMAAGTPLDCEPCLRARGQVAALLGDATSADRWFAQAVRQAPSTPFALAEWGKAKLARGDLDGAIRLFREAQERGPRWADPLKFEGDALARKGKHRDAVRRYAKAAERAPRWGALHLAWGGSLQALGREEQARIEYAQAERLDLSAADRSALQGLSTSAARQTP